MPELRPVPQPGIFAQGTRSHYHLELDLRQGASDGEVLRALAGLRQPHVTAGGANLVLGFGRDAWERFRPGDSPADLAAFTTIEGLDGHSAPGTQRDLWVWVHGTGEDVAFDTARAVGAALAGVAELRLEQPGFVYKDSRDLTGFVDGTANPPLAEAVGAACVAEGVPGAGGSVVLTQRWVHDLDAFHALPVHEQELVFGRTKPDSIELEGDAKPVNAHIARAEVEIDGEEAEIYRRSVPYGTLGEHGLYFLAFSADRRRLDLMLHRIFGVADGVRDRLTDFSRPATGSYFFAPSLTALNDLLDPYDDDDED